MPCQILNMQDMDQKIEQLTAKIQDYAKPVYAFKIFWKGHVYGFTSLEKAILKKTLLQHIRHLLKILNTSKIQSKEKQISALIKSKTSYLLTKSGTASCYPLLIINPVRSLKHVFPEKHCDNILKSALICGGTCISGIYSCRDTDKPVNLQTSNWAWENTFCL